MRLINRNVLGCNSCVLKQVQCIQRKEVMEDKNVLRGETRMNVARKRMLQVSLINVEITRKYHNKETLY